MKKLIKKFKRHERCHNSTREDNVGKVVIKVILCVPRKGHVSVAGNICRTITIADAKVSEVADAIEASLLEE